MSAVPDRVLTKNAARRTTQKPSLDATSHQPLIQMLLDGDGLRGLRNHIQRTRTHDPGSDIFSMQAHATWFSIGLAKGLKHLNNDSTGTGIRGVSKGKQDKLIVILEILNPVLIASCPYSGQGD